MATYRIERLASLIREIVSEGIRTRVHDPRVSRFVTVTRVEVSPDLSYADVFVSVMGSEAEGRTTERGLTSARGMLQSLLAKQLSTRTCPTLRFHLDDSIKRGINIVRRLDEIEGEAPAAASDEEVDDDAELKAEDDDLDADDESELEGDEEAGDDEEDEGEAQRGT